MSSTDTNNEQVQRYHINNIVAFYHGRVAELRRIQMWWLPKMFVCLGVVLFAVFCALPFVWPDAPIEYIAKAISPFLGLGILVFSACYWDLGLWNGMMIYQFARTQTVTEARRRLKAFEIDQETYDLVYIFFHTRLDGYNNTNKA
jgi:peptidoglycan/LPS O-acetylase OafA/YrhL